MQYSMLASVLESCTKASGDSVLDWNHYLVSRTCAVGAADFIIILYHVPVLLVRQTYLVLRTCAVGAADFTKTIGWTALYMALECHLKIHVISTCTCRDVYIYTCMFLVHVRRYQVAGTYILVYSKIIDVHLLYIIIIVIGNLISQKGKTVLS